MIKINGFSKESYCIGVRHLIKTLLEEGKLVLTEKYDLEYRHR